MPRRVYILQVAAGKQELSPENSHYLTNVLRLKDGEEIEVFDSNGRRGRGTLHSSPTPLVEIHELLPTVARPPLVVASAVPKGDRADYLVEKLAELGVSRWIPLQTARSVVHPTGTSKHARWEKIAQEAARQSHAPGVMQVGELTRLGSLSLEGESAWFCSTAAGHEPAAEAPPPSIILVGPEGGFTTEEETGFTAAGAIPVTLGPTILRVETACLVAAAFALTKLA